MVSKEEIDWVIKVLLERQPRVREYEEYQAFESLEGLCAELRRRPEFRMAEARRIVRTLHRKARGKILEAAYEQRMLDAGFAPRAHDMLRRVRPYSPVGMDFRRVGGPHDGGYVMADYGLKNALCLSFGVGPDVSFDLDLAENGCRILLFDHTVDALPAEDDGFTFHRVGLSADDAGDGTTLSLETILQAHVPQEASDMILKIDIEGDEWRVLERMPQSTLRRFAQIAIEFHDFHAVDTDYERKLRVLDNLSTGHRPVHMHCNNYAHIEIVGNTPMPNGLEVTYLRDDICEFDLKPRRFPTELDAPNNPDLPDICLPIDYS